VVRGSGRYAVADPELSSSSGGSRPATQVNVRQLLGPPAAVREEAGDREIWTYRDGLRWHGLALLLVVLPVPLLLPTGRNEAHVTFEAGRAVSLDGRANTTRARAGCLYGAAFPFGARRPCFANGYAAPRAELRRGPAALWSPPPLIRSPSPAEH
jgi:hypothetical protein